MFSLIPRKTKYKQLELNLLRIERRIPKENVVTLTSTDSPDVKVKVTRLPSAVALSSSACFAIFKKTSSRVVRPSWMSDMPNSCSLS